MLDCPGVIPKNEEEGTKAGLVLRNAAKFDSERIDPVPVVKELVDKL